MSSGTQIDSPSLNGGYGEAGALSADATNGTTAQTAAHLTDEEILGIDPPSPQDGYGGRARQDGAGVDGTMPGWLQAAAGDPEHGDEAQRLWREHSEFRAAFSSAAEARGVAQEARAIRELFPGGAQEAQSLKQEAAGLRQAAQSIDRIDAAIFSGDARAQSEVVAEIARANPAAFRSLVAEASRVLSGMGTGENVAAAGPTLRQNREGWGTQRAEDGRFEAEGERAGASETATRDRSLEGRRVEPQSRQDAGATNSRSTAFTSHPPSPEDGFGGRGAFTQHPSRSLEASESSVTSQQAPAFDPVAYSNFERSTNDAVARDVRSTIGDTLARVLPEGVAEGAARRIGDDIFNEIHRALGADRTLSEQVGEALRAPAASGQGWKFGAAEQQRVAALLAGRAKQLVPSVARRVIGEWTSSVLGTARSKAARQAVAASRVDIAAPGGSRDSMPLRPMSSRDVNYASMSDDEILGL